MAAIFREVTLAWQGETYTVTPTYRLIQQVEQRVSIAGLAARIQAGDPPLTQIAFVLATLLAAAGAEVEEVDVYTELHHAGDAKAVQQMVRVVLTAFTPEPPAGNPPASRRGRPSRSKTSRGPSTTKSRSATSA